MDILMQDFVMELQMAKPTYPFLHIRYWEANQEEEAKSEKRRHVRLTKETAGDCEMGSLVIIRRPYSFLEPVVRGMFQGAENVRIIVDRRQDQRRQADLHRTLNRRTSASDRRVAAQMMDILIGLEP